MHATLMRPARGFWGRSIDELKRLSSVAVRSEGIKGPSGPKELHVFRNPDSVADCKVMTDDEIGGFSTAQLDWVSSHSTSSSSSPASGFARFHGTISTRLPANRPDIQRSGYAAWRTADRLPTVFGRSTWDVDSYAYLALRVRSDGRSYLINVQTDSMVAPTDLHQHRLFAQRPGHWETVVVPWSDFVRTNHGFVVEPQTELLRQRVRSVGLGLTDRVPGPFELCIARLWATNNPGEAQETGAEMQDAEEAASAAAAAAAAAPGQSQTTVNIPFSPRAEQHPSDPANSGLKNKHGRPVRWSGAQQQADSQ